MTDFSEDNTVICFLILTTIDQKRNNLTLTGRWRFEKPHRFCHRLDIDLQLELLHRNALTYHHNYLSPEYLADQQQYYTSEACPVQSSYPSEDCPTPTSYLCEDCPIPTIYPSILQCTHHDQHLNKTDDNNHSDETNDSGCQDDSYSSLNTDNNTSEDFDHDRIMNNNIEIDFVSGPFVESNDARSDAGDETVNTDINPDRIFLNPLTNKSSEVFNDIDPLSANSSEFVLSELYFVSSTSNNFPEDNCHFPDREEQYALNCQSSNQNPRKPQIYESENPSKHVLPSLSSRRKHNNLISRKSFDNSLLGFTNQDFPSSDSPVALDIHNPPELNSHSSP